MANVINGRVWSLDTVVASPAEIWEAMVKIQYVEWFNPLAIGDLMQLTDLEDRIIVNGRAEAANGTQIFRLTSWYHGVRMPVLGSGTVFVHMA